MIALLLACSPWTEVAQREAIWWGPTDRLQAETGVELIPLPTGEPVGYWPRVVIGREGIHLDNRAAWLSLPQEVFDVLEPVSLGLGGQDDSCYLL